MKDPNDFNPLVILLGLANRFVIMPIVIILLLWFYAGEIACSLWGFWDFLVAIFN